MNSKKVYTVSIKHNGKEIEDTVLSQSLGSLTVGSHALNNMVISIPGLPEKYRLIERTISGFRLRLPIGVKGTITIGRTTLSLEGLYDFGLLIKKREEFIFPLPDKSPCVLSIGEYTFTFAYKEKPVKEKRVERVERSLKKPLLARDDYGFLFIAIVSIAINFAIAGYLHTVKIRKKDSLEALKELPQRFAKLVLQPPPKVEKKIIPQAKSKEEEKEVIKEEAPQKEEKKQAKKEEAASGPARETSVAVDSGRAAVREAVKSKGLLGVIMAKAKTPDFLEKDLFKDADETDVRKSSMTGLGTGEVLSDIVSHGRGEGVSGLGAEGAASEGGGGSGRGKSRRDTAEILKEKKDIIIADLEKSKPQAADAATLAQLRKRDESEIYKTIMSYIGGLKYLYNNALRKDATLKGKISVKIVVGQDGKVREATMASTTLNNQELEEAMISRIQKWKFPELQGGEDFPITYTFDFSPVG